MKALGARIIATCGALAFAAAPFACSVDLGPMPATCAAGECPEGYDCIRGVCALPGTPVPTTITELQYLRGSDLRVVPTSDGALVVWEIYQYDTELFDFAAVRLRADGSASAPMTIVSAYPASSNYLEPYFDAIAVSDDRLLVAIGAAPPPDDTYVDSRLTLFSVDLPPAGSEPSGATSSELWELRMPSIGYGAVSQPRFARGSKGLELGYFQSLTAPSETDPMKLDTIGQLAVFDLGDDGSKGSAAGPACQARACVTTRKPATGLTIAVSVVDAIVRDDTVSWVLDDLRPSAVVESTGATPGFSDVALPALAIPVEASGSGALTIIEPSKRTGTKLADAPVDGPATLASASATGSVSELFEIGEVRDSPRPAYLARVGKPALLVTPGAELAAPELAVMSVDAASSSATSVAKIARYSKQDIGAIRAAVVGGSLYVAWLDTTSDTAVIRAAVVAEP